MNEKNRQRKENIVNGVKIGILLAAINLGFYTTFCFIWAAVGLPLTEWALWVNLAAAFLTEWAYIRWLTR